MKKKTKKSKPTLKSLERLVALNQNDIAAQHEKLRIFRIRFESELATRAGEAIEFGKGIADIRSLKAQIGYHTNRIINLEKDVESMKPETYKFPTEKVDLLSPGVSWGTINAPQPEKKSIIKWFCSLFSNDSTDPATWEKSASKFKK